MPRSLLDLRVVTPYIRRKHVRPAVGSKELLLLLPDQDPDKSRLSVEGGVLLQLLDKVQPAPLLGLRHPVEVVGWQSQQLAAPLPSEKQAGVERTDTRPVPSRASSSSSSRLIGDVEPALRRHVLTTFLE